MLAVNSLGQIVSMGAEVKLGPYTQDEMLNLDAEGKLLPGHTWEEKVKGQFWMVPGGGPPVLLPTYLGPLPTEKKVSKTDWKKYAVYGGIAVGALLAVVVGYSVVRR